jgi:hypothetical protein
MRGRGAALVIGMITGETEAEQQTAIETTAAQAAPTAPTNPIEQLKKLPELHDHGIISDKEFAAAQKRR